MNRHVRWIVYINKRYACVLAIFISNSWLKSFKIIWHRKTRTLHVQISIHLFNIPYFYVKFYDGNMRVINTGKRNYQYCCICFPHCNWSKGKRRETDETNDDSRKSCLHSFVVVSIVWILFLGIGISLVQDPFEQVYWIIKFLVNACVNFIG